MQCLPVTQCACKRGSLTTSPTPRICSCTFQLAHGCCGTAQGISQGVARQSSRTEREGCTWGAAGAEEVVALPCVNMRDLGCVCPTLRTGAVYRGSQVLR